MGEKELMSCAGPSRSPSLRSWLDVGSNRLVVAGVRLFTEECCKINVPCLALILKIS